MFKKKSFWVLLLSVVLVSVLCIGVSALAEYNTNNHDPTFTVMGSLQGHKSGGYYVNEYGTIRVDANVEDSTFSRLWCTVRLFAMKNGYQTRIDNGEVENTVVMMGDYAGTTRYIFTAGTVTSLSSSYEAEAIDGTSFKPDIPCEDLVLD